MKHFKLYALIALVFFSFSSITESKAQQVTVNISMFQQELGTHGRWYNHPRYGQVWSYRDRSFRPYYTDGHWEYTNYGWSWVSDYDWGWAPFHYGRWEYDSMDGWIWIPGYEWAPAWVSWSSYDGYYGWAPLGFGLNLNISFGSIPYNRWTFIPRRNMCDRDIRRYYVSSERNYGFRHAVLINNHERNERDGRYFRGPERNEVERYTTNRIEERRVDDRERNGFRPERNDRNIERNRNQSDNMVRDRDRRTNDLPVRTEDNRKPNREETRKPNQENNNPRNDNRVNGNRENNIPGRPQTIDRPNRDQRTPPIREQRTNEIRRDNGNGNERTKPTETRRENNNPKGNGRKGDQ